MIVLVVLMIIPVIDDRNDCSGSNDDVVGSMQMIAMQAKLLLLISCIGI